MARRKPLRYEVFERPRSKAEAWGVPPLAPGCKRELPLLVIGTGRCGTTWLSKTLQDAGFDIPHEHTGQHGTVSMYFQKDANWYPYFPWVRGGKTIHVEERRSDFSFKHTVHLVRHPLEVIPSAMKIFPSITYQWANTVGLLPLFVPDRGKTFNTMLMVYNMLLNCAREADTTVRLQDVPKKWKDMLRRAGLDYVDMPVLPPKNRSTGFRKAEKMTWADLEAVDKTLTQHLRKLTRSFRLE